MSFGKRKNSKANMNSNFKIHTKSSKSNYRGAATLVRDSIQKVPQDITSLEDKFKTEKMDLTVSH